MRPSTASRTARENDDPARRRFCLKAGGDVDAISVKIVAIDDQVAQVQAHTEHKGGVCRLVADWPRPWPAETR